MAGNTGRLGHMRSRQMHYLESEFNARRRGELNGPGRPNE